MTAAVAGAALFIAAAPAEAVLLPPGGTVSPLIEPIDPTSTQLAAINNAAFVAQTFSGTYDAAVYSDPSNPFCAGCLTFMYQVTSNASSTTAIARVVPFSFQNFLTDVAQNGGPFDIFVAGTEDAITADRDATGVNVGFQFSPPDSEKIGPGETSFILIVRTNATNFTAGFISIINGGSTNVAGFQPAPAVPEPGALALLGLGFLGTAAMARRRLTGK